MFEPQPSLHLCREWQYPQLNVREQFIEDYQVYVISKSRCDTSSLRLSGGYDTCSMIDPYSSVCLESGRACAVLCRERVKGTTTPVIPCLVCSKELSSKHQCAWTHPAAMMWPHALSLNFYNVEAKNMLWYEETSVYVCVCVATHPVLHDRMIAWQYIRRTYTSVTMSLNVAQVYPITARLWAF